MANLADSNWLLELKSFQLKVTKKSLLICKIVRTNKLQQFCFVFEATYLRKLYTTNFDLDCGEMSGRWMKICELLKLLEREISRNE